MELCLQKCVENLNYFNRDKETETYILNEMQQTSLIKFPIRMSDKFDSKKTVTPIWKRLFDIIVRYLSIILLLPLIILIIMQQIKSPGPIFYKGEPVGTGYSIFKCYKF